MILNYISIWSNTGSFKSENERYHNMIRAYLKSFLTGKVSEREKKQKRLKPEKKRMLKILLVPFFPYRIRATIYLFFLSQTRYPQIYSQN